MSWILAITIALSPPPQVATGLSSSEKSKAVKIVTRYFKEWDREKRRVILAELEPLDHPSAADIRNFQKRCFKLARTALPRQKGKGPYKCLQPSIQGEYIARIPSSVRRGSGKAGVFLSLHGSGGTGRGTERAIGLPDSKLICVFPTVKERRGGWGDAKGQEFVIAILDELKRTYKVDTNRIYIAGHSMGGYGAWTIGGKHADLFAASAPMAGGTYEPGVVPNYRNLALRCYNAEDDPQVKPDMSIRAFERIDKQLRPKYGGYPAEFHLYPPADGIGHGFPKKRGHDVRAIIAWMLKHWRDPRPERVVWEPSLAWKNQFYWLHSTSRSGIADVQRKGNTLTVSGSVRDLSIQLNDKLCDLKKPVIVKRITREGEQEVFNGVPKLSLRVLVESIGEYNDPEMVFVARVPAR